INFLECKYIAFYLSGKRIARHFLIKKIPYNSLYLCMFALINELRVLKVRKQDKYVAIEK
uniref:hypothetical protein n=1 Tax=uncultured Parabacteroides sp. TaxID=512312 RepID=UPI002589F44E